MKAMVMTAVGGPEVLELQEVATPLPRGRELRVRLRAAGVNPVDTKLRAGGTFFPERMPTILGCDGAGIVDAVGTEATRFKAGDAVYFCNGGIGGHPGNYCDYAVIDERFAARKPATLSFDEAAAAPLVLITAWEALHDRGRLQEDDRVLVHAGAGGVGHVAIQLARLTGARVATTVSSMAKARFVRDLGAERIVEYPNEDFVAAVNAWSQGGVDLALDTVGGETLNRTISAVRYGGDLVTVLTPRSDFDWQAARLRNLRLGLELMLGPMVASLTSAQEHHGEILRRCAEHFDRGELRVEVRHRFALEQAAEAHNLLEAGGIIGKIVLQMEQ